MATADRPGWLAVPTPEELARAAEPEPSGPTGRSVVYTLHFDPPYRPSPDAPPYKTAGHYTGWAANLEKRLAEHEAGRGARLTQVQAEAGGTWRVAAVEPGTRFRERQLKAHSAGRRCPICKAEVQAAPEAEAEPELEAGYLMATTSAQRIADLERQVADLAARVEQLAQQALAVGTLEQMRLARQGYAEGRHPARAASRPRHLLAVGGSTS